MANTSIELINYAVDVQADQNMKFMLLVLISVYTILATWYFNNKDTKDELYIFYLFKRLNQVFLIAWFIFLPLTSIIMYRTVSFESVFLLPLIGFYVLLFALIPALVLFGYGEKLIRWTMSFFGKEKWVKFKRENQE